MKTRLKNNKIDFRLVEIGKVKIGQKNEKGFPTSLDHFIGYGKYAKLFNDAYPKESTITISFVSDDDSYSCSETMVLRNKAGKIFAKTDLETINYYDGKDYVSHPYSPEFFSRCEEKTGTKWERVLMLRFVVPKVRGIIGTWRLETKADKSSIDSIINTYDFVKSKAGTVNRILFDLTVEKVKSQKPDNPSSYPVLKLICNMTEENLKLIPQIKSLNDYVNDESVKQLSGSKVDQANQKQLKMHLFETNLKKTND